MFISCPNCATRYNVTPGQLGQTGKSVRCSNCGNTWHQNPVADAPPPAMPAGNAGFAPQQQMPVAPYPQPHPQAAYPYPPPGYPPYPAPPGYPPYPQAPGAPAPESLQSAPASAPAAPPPPPEPEPEPEPVSDPDEPDPMAALMDDIAGDENTARDEDPMAAFDTGEDDGDDEALSQDDIEALFDDEEDDDAAIESIIEDGDDEDDGTAFDDLEEPDPIPEVFTADETGDDEDTEYDDYDDDEDESSGSMVKIIIAVVLLVLILGSVGAALFLKNTIISTFPSAEGIYSTIGLEDDSLGAGLSINDVKSTRESIGGKDVLVVRGDVVNVSERIRNIPILELRLADTEGNTVQSAQSAPLKNEIVAGDKISFEIQLENPSSLARKLEVTFVERPAAGN